MCFGLEENSILFTGDHVMGWSTTVIIPPDGDMTDYIKSLEKVAACEYKTFFPTHGAPIKEPKKFVRALIGHRKMREKQILDELEKAPLCIDEMVRKFYKNTCPIGAKMGNQAEIFNFWWYLRHLSYCRLRSSAKTTFRRKIVAIFMFFSDRTQTNK